MIFFVLKVDITGARNWEVASIHLNWRKKTIRQGALNANGLALLALGTVGFAVLVDEAEGLCEDAGTAFTLAFRTSRAWEGEVLAVVGDFFLARFVAWGADMDSWRSDGDGCGEEGGGDEGSENAC